MKVSSASGWKLVLVCLTVGILYTLCAVPAYADCSTDNPATCVYVPKGQSLNVTPGFSGASPSCQEVENNCAGDIMIPTASQTEWSSFLGTGIVTGGDGIRQCVTVTSCTCSPSTVANGTISAYPGCVLSCNTGYHISGSSCAADNYSYAWTQSGWGACSLSCGGGTQTQSVGCQQTDTTTGVVATVDNSLCVTALGGEPATSQSCNNQACVVCNAENLNVWIRPYTGYFGFSTRPETCGGDDGCPGYTADPTVNYNTDYTYEDAGGALFYFNETNYNALNGYDGECLGCGQNGGGDGVGTVDTLAYIEANSNLTNSTIIADYLTTPDGKADNNMQQCYNSGNISSINIVEYTIISPLKVNIAGGNARLNVSRPLTFTMTRPKGKVIQRTTTGGLNADEAWLMINRDGKGLKNGNVVNGDNWFSDGKNHDSAYDQLAEEFASYIQKDEHGHRYIPLHKLSDAERAAAQQAAQSGNAAVKASTISEPSKSLLLLDVNDNVYFASDFFDRIYVSYFRVGETDTSFTNHILQRSVVRDLKGQYHYSADQWFGFKGNKGSLHGTEGINHHQKTQ